MIVCSLLLAATSAVSAPQTWQTECLGYYTMRLPGSIEYALQQLPWQATWNPEFSDRLGAWNTEFLVDTGGVSAHSDRVEISARAQQRDLEKVAHDINARLESKRDSLLKDADWAAKDGRPVASAAALKEAAAIRLLAVGKGGLTYSAAGEGTIIYTLVGGRIVAAVRKDPDLFLRKYRPRAIFEVPKEDGVCLPHAFVSGQKAPASVGISFRLQQRPDIVIHLHDGAYPTSLKADPSPIGFLTNEVDSSFYGATSFNPLDGRSQPFREIKIDGRKGLSIFGKVTRDRLAEIKPANAKPGDGDDWVFLAYVHAGDNAARSASSDLMLRVERYSQLAKQPMSEMKFRELVGQLATSVQRRPGAFVSR